MKIYRSIKFMNK